MDKLSKLNLLERRVVVSRYIKGADAERLMELEEWVEARRVALREERQKRIGYLERGLKG